MSCSFCGACTDSVFLDLGTAPPSNAFLSRDALSGPESWFPLRLVTCARCFLVQVDPAQPPETLFTPDYVYHSSVSRSWLDHASRFADYAISTLRLAQDSLVIEAASNDGYLLRNFVERGIPCLGIEPTEGTAKVARNQGVETLVEFLGSSLASRLVEERGAADLVVANNVLAHVPDLNDFVAGLSMLLAPNGTISCEFPHLFSMVTGSQFDTAYHEHYSYFSFGTVKTIFAAHGLRAWHVEHLQTHGGSLRVWACRQDAEFEESPAVQSLLLAESTAGMRSIDWYEGFQRTAERIKDDFLSFLISCKREGTRVAGYGAAAKGNTLINYAGARADLIPFVADASPYKQGRYLPGSRIPVVSEDRLREERPDIVIVLPWNLRSEITRQLSYIRDWGGRFAFAVPQLEIQ